MKRRKPPLITESPEVKRFWDDLLLRAMADTSPSNSTVFIGMGGIYTASDTTYPTNDLPINSCNPFAFAPKPKPVHVNGFRLPKSGKHRHQRR